MWFKVKKYIMFLWKSKNKHGVHSPFVFNLVTKCFNSKTDIVKLELFNNVLQYILDNKDSIGYQEIKIINKKKVALLIRITEYFKVNSILELGPNFGINNAIFSISNSNCNITSIHNCENSGKEIQKVLQLFNLPSINIVSGEYQNTLNSIFENNSFDLINFDVKCNKIKTLRYFEQSLKSIHNDSILIFHNINNCKEMNKVWAEIRKHPKVKVTVDVYYFGIVFFREEQAKQHFTLRT